MLDMVCDQGPEEWARCPRNGRDAPLRRAHCSIAFAVADRLAAGANEPDSTSDKLRRATNVNGRHMNVPPLVAVGMLWRHRLVTLDACTQVTARSLADDRGQHHESTRATRNRCARIGHTTGRPPL